MEGITILNTYQGVIGYTWGVDACVIVLGLLAIAGFLVMISGIPMESEPIFTAGILAGIVFIALALMCASKATPIYIPHYEVTIDETVPYQELIHNYEIVGRRGEIFILKDKDGYDE